MYGTPRLYSWSRLKTAKEMEEEEEERGAEADGGVEARERDGVERGRGVPGRAAQTNDKKMTTVRRCDACGNQSAHAAPTRQNLSPSSKHQRQQELGARVDNVMHERWQELRACAGGRRLPMWRAAQAACKRQKPSPSGMHKRQREHSAQERTVPHTRRSAQAARQSYRRAATVQAKGGWRDARSHQRDHRLGAQAAQLNAR